MKKQTKTKHTSVLHFTLRYLIVRRKQEQLHNKLLLALNDCCSKQELQYVLHFKSLHTEPLLMQVYRRRLTELEQQQQAAA